MSWLLFRDKRLIYGNGANRGVVDGGQLKFSMISGCETLAQLGMRGIPVQADSRREGSNISHDREEKNSAEYKYRGSKKSPLLENEAPRLGSAGRGGGAWAQR